MLKAELDLYDVGYWIVYDQLNRVDVVNGYYVSFIVEQLKALHAISGEPEFAHRAQKWTEYQLQHSLFGHMAFEEYSKAMRSLK